MPNPEQLTYVPGSPPRAPITNLASLLSGQKVLTARRQLTADEKNLRRTQELDLGWGRYFTIVMISLEGCKAMSITIKNR